MTKSLCYWFLTMSLTILTVSPFKGSCLRSARWFLTCHSLCLTTFHTVHSLTCYGIQGNPAKDIPLKHQAQLALPGHGRIKHVKQQRVVKRASRNHDKKVVP